MNKQVRLRQTRFGHGDSGTLICMLFVIVIALHCDDARTTRIALNPELRVVRHISERQCCFDVEQRRNPTPYGCWASARLSSSAVFALYTFAASNTSYTRQHQSFSSIIASSCS